ncbi:unnamed protein product [Cunninghamella blakesleeana]
MNSSFDPSPLTYLCSIQQVKIDILELNGSIRTKGDCFHIDIYVTTYESLIIEGKLSTSKDNDTPITITVPSQASAYLLNDNTLTLPHTSGGLWSLDCSSSNPDDFIKLKDILTFFIKFENQHNIKNTLVMMNPNSCQITQVIAENVYLGKERNINVDEDNDDDLSSDLADDDFITTRENYYGQKLAVSMDESVFKDGLELRKVRLINQTSHCMDVGSDWVARGLIRAGDTIAGYIQRGSNSVKSKMEPSDMQLVLSRNEKHYLNFFYNLTAVIGSMTGRWIGRLFGMASSNIQQYYKPDFRIPTPENKLGNSALQAASRIMEGTAIAAGTVFSATRDSLTQVVQRKYGHDAGFLVEKLMGGSSNGTHGSDILVYFDGNGISRKVVMQNYQEVTSSFNRANQNSNNNTNISSPFNNFNDNNNIPTPSTKYDDEIHRQPFDTYTTNDLFDSVEPTISERQIVYDIDEANEQVILV